MRFTAKAADISAAGARRVLASIAERPGLLERRGC